ncbi:hypothetical protein MTR_3g061380 [Medicago truncatula]|uniref:Uncharacterized protein n=1 Tax=Medicago truncatula TaxID=3880 RepID=G7IY93_MEDTR|nr:hypothetical protein MTR_3g061380 [Medicago truncatula]
MNMSCSTIGAATYNKKKKPHKYEFEGQGWNPQPCIVHCGIGFRFRSVNTVDTSIQQ